MVLLGLQRGTQLGDLVQRRPSLFVRAAQRIQLRAQRSRLARLTAGSRLQGPVCGGQQRAQLRSLFQRLLCALLLRVRALGRRLPHT